MASASQAMPLRGVKLFSWMARQRTIRCATVDRQGEIYLTPLWFVSDATGRIHIPLDAGNRHARNVEAGSRVTAVVDSGEEYATVAGVRLYGTLHLVLDPVECGRVSEELRDKYFHPGHPHAHAYDEFGDFAGRTFHELRVDRRIGWDMREGSGPAMPERRLLPVHARSVLLDTQNH